MRWTLPLLGLLAAATTCLRADARSPKAGAGWPHEVEGLGQTYEAARENALDQAQQQIVAFLRKQKPPLRHWEPTRDYIRKHFLQGQGKPGEDLAIDAEDLKVAKSWLL